MSSKHLIKTLGLALVAVLAMSAVVASAAFAGGTSKWEPKAGGIAGIKFEGKMKAGSPKPTFETESGSTVTCETSKSTGEFKSATEAEATVTYSGKCTLAGAPAGNGACTNVAGKEEIKTNALKVEPGDELNKGAEVGMDFSPKAAGGSLAEFTCQAGLKIKVTGSVICKIPAAAVGKFQAKGEVICKKAAKKGEQEFTEITLAGGKVKDVLTAEGSLGFFKTTEKDSQETTEELTYLPAGTEIKQTP